MLTSLIIDTLRSCLGEHSRELHRVTQDRTRTLALDRIVEHAVEPGRVRDRDDLAGTGD
jgi:hypothetical protein